MQRAWPRTVASTLLAIPAVSVVLGSSPPADFPEARPAPLYNPVSRCPQVRIADEGTIAVVVFLVGPSGVPSKASIKRSSQSSELDAAALECVMKLRYSPTVSVGDGTAIAAWQQLGWRWTAAPQPGGAGPAPTQQSAAVAAPVAAAGSSAAPAAGAAAGAAAGGAALAGAATPAGTAGGAAASASASTAPVELRVCADTAGRLSQDPTVIHSSGDPGLDQAAIRIAKAGSGNYRPAATLNGKPTSGCAQLSVRFE
jgi:TonB family protein